jgi:aspartyl-tRNA(Asn)/glutamyl-tRNA(Gln) amidotransferase subunit A
MDEELLNLTCKQLRDKIAAGAVTSVAACNEVFAQTEALDDKVGAYISTYKDLALEAAKTIDQKIAAGEPTGPLAGVPVAIKDNMCTDFGATTCASKILENFRAPYNAHVVEKLRAAGAVIVGKTNLDEFAMGSSTENSGLKQTVNPWDTTTVPGGSSGGSAAAVAARMCMAALGSDTGGSIRQPAGFCGVVGLKPTYGRVSRYGLVAFGSSLDQIGPVTQDVTDAALMMNVIAGHDKRDSTSVSDDMAGVCDYLEKIDEEVKGLKIAVVPQFNTGANEDVQNALARALEVYKDLGAEIVEVQMPHLEYAIAAYYIIATAEASSNLARYDGVHYGHRTENPADYVEVYSKSRAEGFGTEVKRRIMLGTYALSSGYYDAYYLKALKVRNLIRADFAKALEKADCIVTPTSPTTAFKIGEKIEDPLQMYLADIYTIGANLAGLPAISIPCGFDKANLPIGLQILAPAFTEDKLLRIARMYETKTDYHKAKPNLVDPAK